MGSIILATEATIVWSAEQWADTKKSDAAGINALELRFADFSMKTMPAGSIVEFTFFWKKDQRWEGSNYLVAVDEANIETKERS